MIECMKIEEFYSSEIPEIKFDCKLDALAFEVKLLEYINSDKAKDEFIEFTKDYPTIESLIWYINHDVIPWEGRMTEELILALENCIGPENPYKYLMIYLLNKFGYL